MYIYNNTVHNEIKNDTKTVQNLTKKKHFHTVAPTFDSLASVFVRFSETPSTDGDNGLFKLSDLNCTIIAVILSHPLSEYKLYFDKHESNI